MPTASTPTTQMNAYQQRVKDCHLKFFLEKQTHLITQQA